MPADIAGILVGRKFICCVLSTYFMGDYGVKERGTLYYGILMEMDDDVRSHHIDLRMNTYYLQCNINVL